MKIYIELTHFNSQGAMGGQVMVCAAQAPQQRRARSAPSAAQSFCSSAPTHSLKPRTPPAASSMVASIRSLSVLSEHCAFIASKSSIDRSAVRAITSIMEGGEPMHTKMKISCR